MERIISMWNDWWKLNKIIIFLKILKVAYAEYKSREILNMHHFLLSEHHTISLKKKNFKFALIFWGLKRA